jgi:hypothetical protein
MARKAQQQRHPISGAPGVRPGVGASLNPLSVANRAGSAGLVLDPTVAAAQVDHPSTRWAGLELLPIRPREDR